MNVPRIIRYKKKGGKKRKKEGKGTERKTFQHGKLVPKAEMKFIAT
jgi:hypothetical protein